LRLTVGVGINPNVKARLLLQERYVLAANRFAEIVIWELPDSPRSGLQRFKYRLAFVVDEVCVLRFDNEVGKGDHKHVGSKEMPYDFVSPEALVADFWNEVAQWQTR